MASNAEILADGIATMLVRNSDNPSQPVSIELDDDGFASFVVVTPLGRFRIEVAPVTPDA